MYSLEISIENLDPSSEIQFNKATDRFLSELGNLPELNLKLEQVKRPSTRSLVTLLSGIILTGTSLGAFSALYTLYKDLGELYANAEVQLHFDDGSTITLKNLTRQEAEQVLREHLEKFKPPSKH
ncbi:MAG: hypothetical protein JNM55_20940 [Anaerolineales bacterium]|nr:hypothetical protein [Anaerolineales bacterium]